MSRDPTSPSRTRKQRDRTVGRRRASASAHRMMVTPAGRFLERLEQGRLRVLVHPVGGLDDGDASATLDRHERQLADEVLHATVLGVRPAHDDLATRTGGSEPMEVGVIAVLDQPARATRPARSLVRTGHAQQPGREVERQRRLADPVRADEQDGLGSRTPDHGGDRDERGGLPPGPGPFHRTNGQAFSAGAALRVVRRFGVAAGAASPSADASGSAVTLAAAGLRGARGLAVLAGASPSAGSASAAGAASAASADAVAADLRGARAFGASVALAAAVVRGAAGLRAARVFGAAAWLDHVGPFDRVGRGLVDHRGRAGRLGTGFWATCARSIASSSGGTSLHGSLELRGADAAGRSAGRSPRP